MTRMAEAKCVPLQQPALCIPIQRHRRKKNRFKQGQAKKNIEGILHGATRRKKPTKVGQGRCSRCGSRAGTCSRRSCRNPTGVAAKQFVENGIRSMKERAQRLVNRLPTGEGAAAAPWQVEDALEGAKWWHPACPSHGHHVRLIRCTIDGGAANQLPTRSAKPLPSSGTAAASPAAAGGAPVVVAERSRDSGEGMCSLCSTQVACYACDFCAENYCVHCIVSTSDTADPQASQSGRTAATVPHTISEADGDADGATMSDLCSRLSHSLSLLINQGGPKQHPTAHGSMDVPAPLMNAAASMVSSINELAVAHRRGMPTKQDRQARTKARRDPPRLVPSDDGLGWDTTYFAADDETIKSIASAAQLDPSEVSANNGCTAVNARLRHNTGVFLPTTKLQWAQEHFQKTLDGGRATASTTPNSHRRGRTVNTSNGCSPSPRGGTRSGTAICAKTKRGREGRGEPNNSKRPRQ